MNLDQQTDEALRTALYAIGTCPPGSRQVQTSLAWLNFLLTIGRVAEESDTFRRPNAKARL